MFSYLIICYAKRLLLLRFYNVFFDIFKFKNTRCCESTNCNMIFFMGIRLYFRIEVGRVV